jgi:hypothetical protein
MPFRPSSLLRYAYLFQELKPIGIGSRAAPPILVPSTQPAIGSYQDALRNTSLQPTPCIFGRRLSDVVLSRVSWNQLGQLETRTQRG